MWQLGFGCNQKAQTEGSTARRVLVWAAFAPSVHTQLSYIHTLCTGIPQEKPIINVKALGAIIQHAFMHTPAPSDIPRGAVCFVPNQCVCSKQALFKEWYSIVSEKKKRESVNSYDVINQEA